MAHLIYSAMSSLDGYTEDIDGKFDWAAPDEEMLRFINDLKQAAVLISMDVECMRL